MADWAHGVGTGEGGELQWLSKTHSEGALLVTMVVVEGDHNVTTLKLTFGIYLKLVIKKQKIQGISFLPKRFRWKDLL